MAYKVLQHSQHEFRISTTLQQMLCGNIHARFNLQHMRMMNEIQMFIPISSLKSPIRLACALMLPIKYAYASFAPKIHFEVPV